MTSSHAWNAGVVWKDNQLAIQHVTDIENSDGRSNG